MTSIKKTCLIRWAVLLAVFCAAVMLASVSTAFADVDKEITMTQGDVIQDFVEKDAYVESEDPTVAWVDDTGALNALQPGTTYVMVSETEASAEAIYKVTVNEYSDGSEVVGRLKLLARYNDSMKFWEGHSYLLLTSYQDGVDIKVDDLYGGYDISPEYYDDIREDISNGSNHTGNDADKYFTFNSEMDSMTLNRGDIVTIGMYRGFDLTEYQAAFGSLKNSTMWGELKKEGKTEAVEAIFQMLDKGQISMEDAVTRLIVLFMETGIDYKNWLDGVVEGGVCFNRELYNQKLEWDQYENVTYELDITKKQLDTLTEYLGGNLDNFSFVSNSCATVALRAWNAAIGTTEDGEPNAYYLEIERSGIEKYMDVPRGVRKAIEKRLPGYYLNNSDFVEEPDAGFEDETGWVYVSAPEPIYPATYHYDSDDLTLLFKEPGTTPVDILNKAKAGTQVAYNKDDQQIGVHINKTQNGDFTTVNSIDFTVNGITVNAGPEDVPENGMWLSAKLPAMAHGGDYYAVDGDGNVYPSEVEEGRLWFWADSLPMTYKIVESQDSPKNVLQTKVIDNNIDGEVEFYWYDGAEKKVIDGKGTVPGGTKVYAKVDFDDVEFWGTLGDITLNGENIKSPENYDAEEGAYFAYMPAKYSRMNVYFVKAKATAKKESPLQISVNKQLDVDDFIEVLIGNDKEKTDEIKWTIISDQDHVFEISDDERVLTAKKAGTAVVAAGSAYNMNIGDIYRVEIYQSVASMAKVIFDEESDYRVRTNEDSGLVRTIPYSGYRVPKGTELTVDSRQTGPVVVSNIKCNGKKVEPGKKITANDDVEIEVSYKEAEIDGMPRSIELAKKGDTYKLGGKVKYKGLIQQFFPVYDSSISYVSSDPLLEVSDEGVVTVTGDIPQDGIMVIITAYAGSSNNQVTAQCRVNVGDYKGAKIVGKLTISARTFGKDCDIPHGCLTFTAYEDVEMNASYLHYYKPEDKMIKLLEDYNKHPSKYAHDPALYNNDELGIKDRESYFKDLTAAPHAEPQKVSLKADESITVSNYGLGDTNLDMVLEALENGSMSYSPSTQKLIEQVYLYKEGKPIDGDVAFDSMVETLIQAYLMAYLTGENPINGESPNGGLCINREIFNQFRRNDTQLPNDYYEVEITADELAALKEYLANPDNNYYSLFAKNCATGAVDAWNAALSDRPELQVKGNYTGFASESISLNIDIKRLKNKKNIDGQGGKDFYPRPIKYDPQKEDPEHHDDDDDKKKVDVAKNSLKLNSAYKVTQTGSKVTVKWAKVSGAAKYKVFAAYCGKGKMKVVKTVKKGTKTSFKKIGKKKIKLTKNMKVQVIAYDKNGKKIAKSITAHIIGRKNKKYTNPKKIKLTKKSYTVKKGKKTKIKAKIVLVDKKKKNLTNKHAKKFRYATSNSKIATVSRKGVIKGRSKGTCNVYIYARNGCTKKVKVTVK